MRTHVRDNLIKNVLILLFAAFFYPVLSQALASINVQDINNFLLIVSILLVTVCFANFAFTYEKSSLLSLGGKLLSHGATFIFMLLLALLLECMVISIKAVYPSLRGMIIWFSILLYIGVTMFDFWDVLRANNDEKNFPQT